MSELQQFLHMGGYAPFVWSAYGAWLMLLLWMLLAALGRGRRVRRELRRRFELESLQAGRPADEPMSPSVGPPAEQIPESITPEANRR